MSRTSEQPKAAILAGTTATSKNARTALVLILLAAALLATVWPSERVQRSREQILADVHARLATFECSRVTVANFAEESGTLTLAGDTESSAQQAAIRRATQNVPGVQTVEESLRIVPRPFCSAIALLDPFRENSESTRFGLSVRPQSGCDTVYRADDSLVVDVAAVQPLQYVYVDYFVADQVNTAHLLPNPGEADHYLPESRHYVVGGPDSIVKWQVEPPFGLELITVIATPQPLFTKPRPAEEGALDYIDELRAVLPKEASAAAVAAAYCLITTSE